MAGELDYTFRAMGSDVRLLIAIPLREVTQTLHRLLFVEALAGLPLTAALAEFLASKGGARR